MPTRGLLIVFSAPSGAGKSTLCNMLVERNKNIRFSISCTTRPRRKGEVNGRDYFFISVDEFKAMVKRNEFVEWAKVHDNYYGTPKSFLEKTLSAGKDIILDIDVQGGINIRKLYPEAVLIYIMAPTLKELEKRLRGRNKDSEEVIERRMHNARRELKCLPKYDYLIINGRKAKAYAELKCIIASERLRVVHREELPEF